MCVQFYIVLQWPKNHSPRATFLWSSLTGARHPWRLWGLLYSHQECSDGALAYTRYCQCIRPIGLHAEHFPEVLPSKINAKVVPRTDFGNLSAGCQNIVHVKTMALFVWNHPWIRQPLSWPNLVQFVRTPGNGPSVLLRGQGFWCLDVPVEIHQRIATEMNDIYNDYEWFISLIFSDHIQERKLKVDTRHFPAKNEDRLTLHSLTVYKTGTVLVPQVRMYPSRFPRWELGGRMINECRAGYCRIYLWYPLIWASRTSYVVHIYNMYIYGYFMGILDTVAITLQPQRLLAAMMKGDQPLGCEVEIYPTLRCYLAIAWTRRCDGCLAAGSQTL